MKWKTTLLMTAVWSFCFGVTASVAQEKPAWGSDVNVAPEAGKFYKDVRTTVAYDGTIYLGRLVGDNAEGPFKKWEILKSTDQGETFSAFVSDSYTSGSAKKITAFDICAAGEDAGSFRIFVAVPAIDSPAGKAYMQTAAITAGGTKTGLPFSGENYSLFISNRGFSSVSWATDSRKPAAVSTPYTICLVAAKCASVDSVVAWSSPDGGVSFTRKGIISAGLFVNRVSAALGVNDNKSDYPRLGVAYEYFVHIYDTVGKVFVRYVYGDNLGDLGSLGEPFEIGAAGGIYANPTIAMSQTLGAGTGPGYDDFRTVVAFEVIDAGLDVNFYCIDGLMFTTPDFSGTSVSISGGTGSQCRPHIIFDPAFKNFLLTYYNAQTGKIPYLIKGFDSPVAQPFLQLIPNFRDATTKPYPFIEPRVDMHIGAGKAVFAWNDNYNSMFDAEYFTLAVGNISRNAAEVKVYPNPASASLFLDVTADQADVAIVSITDVTGKRILSQQTNFVSGQNQIQMDVRQLPAGSYILQLSGAHTQATAHLTVLH